MKKALLLLLICLSAFIAAKAQTSQLELVSFKESVSEGGMSNLSVLLKGKEWPKDSNDKDYCAWVRVTFQNMTKTDALKTSFNFGTTSPIKDKEDKLNEDYHEIWLWVTPSDFAIMEASLPKYGKSNRLHNLKLKPKGVYDVVLKNNKTVTINVDTNPAGAIVTLDNDEKKPSPATFTDLALGEHTLTISLDGQTKLLENIMVTEENVRFSYDIRKKKEVTFLSDPSGATLYIDGEKKGSTPATFELPYGSYQVEARLGINEQDVQSITVGDLSPKEITLEPIKKKTFDVYAMYNDQKVNADLYIDGKSEGANQSSYTLTLPIGKTYKMQMNYYGNSKKRTIKVRENMAIDQEFKISARNTITWWWQKEYDATPGGFSAGYATKQYVTTGEGAKIKEDAWGRRNKMMHGMQIGLHFQPAFSFGLGLYTGLFYELYMSFNSENTNTEYYDQIVEHNLYLPLHLYYRIPFSRKVALTIHGGIGMDCGVYAEFKDSQNENVESSTNYYGEEGWPKRFNFSAEIGGGLRLGPIQLNVLYSKGLNDHEFYSDPGNSKTIQKKLVGSISYVFGGN